MGLMLPGRGAVGLGLIPNTLHTCLSRGTMASDHPSGENASLETSLSLEKATSPPVSGGGDEGRDGDSNKEL